MASPAESIDLRRFTVDEYHRIAESGVFRPDERLELFRGVVRRMTPKNYGHVVAVAKTVKLLTITAGHRASIYPEAPLELVELDSVPEPDILVTESPIAEDYGKTRPRLVIEVAESSRGYDLGAKAALYADASIAEYWVVDLVNRELVVFRAPDGASYAERAVYRPGDVVQPLRWADLTLEVAELFPAVDAN